MEVTEPPAATPKRRKINPEYRIAYLSALGALGFMIGCIVMFYPNIFSGKSGSNFHEIIYEPVKSAAKVIKPYTDTIQRAIKSNTLLIEKNDKLKKGMANPDSIALLSAENTRITSIRTADTATLKQLYKYLTDTLYAADTSVFNKYNTALHYNINADSIDNWNNRFIGINKDSISRWSATAGYSLIDAKIPVPLTGRDIFRMRSYSSDVDFLTKYPAIGTWVILILIFCSFSFITVSACVYLNDQVKNFVEQMQITEELKTKRDDLTGRYYWICLVVFIILGLLFLLWRYTFYDNSVIKSMYFFSLTTAMFWVILFGYVAGTFCLAGFIHSSSLLTFFIIESKPNAATDGQPDDNNHRIKTFAKLYSAFNSYFVLSAIVLSLVVLCTGSLYTAVNTLDFLKLLTSDWGYSPVRNDFVYLYAGLYTVILLLVYVPAKIKFQEFRLEFQGTVPGADGNTGWSNFLKNPFTDQLKGILVATSPLLTGLLQSLFDALFK